MSMLRGLNAHSFQGLNGPVVSVGMPVYNGERYVATAIDSVLAQTFPNFELVICDNGSTDGTEAICRDRAARDRRIRYCRNEVNIGAAGNFCRVFELSTGRYFRWLSADDYMAPAALRQCLAALDAEPLAVLACGKVALVGADGEVLAPYAEAQSLEYASPVDRFRAVTEQDPMCNAVYGLMRREVLRRTRLLGAFSGSDCTLLAELSLYGRFVEVPEVLFFRRIHPGAYSWITSTEQVRAFYAPNAKRKTALLLRAWRHRFENVRAVLRAPLTLPERARLLARIARMAWWERRELGREIFVGLRSLAGR